jgi:inorganic pyrophosphatase
MLFHEQMISEISKECSAVMFRVGQSKKNSYMQEHYTIGMDIEDDGEPLGALLLRPWVY